MMDNIINILGIKEYENIRKIPKNTFYKVDDFSKSNEKLFTNDIDAIYIISALNKNVINISEYKTDEYNYSEIYYIYVSLKSNKKLSDIRKIIHNIIPNPCIIIFGYGNNIVISTATKRISKNDKTKQVIEDYYTTLKIDLDYLSDIEKEFLEDIKLTNNSFENFKRFYIDFSNKILIIKTSELRGGYIKTNLENIGRLLELYKNNKRILIDITNLNKEYDLEIAMGPKAFLHSKKILLEKELEKNKQNIKDI